MENIHEGWNTCPDCGKKYLVTKIKYPSKDESHSLYCPTCEAVVGKVPKGTDDYVLISEDEINRRAREEALKPNCPMCGDKMKLREGRTKFWGCRNYPNCKGTRQI